MTPAIDAAIQAGIAYVVHQYEHDPKSRAFGLEAAEKLGLDPATVFKTLIVEIDTSALAVAVIPCTGLLNMRQLARARKVERAAIADRAAAARATGYIMGEISPLGKKKRLRTGIDHSATAFKRIYVSGGRRGRDLEVEPADLIRLTAALSADLC